jgi:hypothetical protein
MQFARKFAWHRVPTILSHRKMNISGKAETQHAMPVFLIDSGQHSDLS